MSINPARYGLITNEYRYKEVSNSLVTTRYSMARELEIETALDMANLSTLILEMFGVIGEPRRRFIVELVGTDFIDINSFQGQLPCVYYTNPDHSADNMVCAITRAVIKESENTTVVELWG